MKHLVLLMLVGGLAACYRQPTSLTPDGGERPPVTCSGWTKIASSTAGSYSRIWGSSADNVYILFILFKHGTSAGGSKILRYDGTSVSTQRSSKYAPTAIWGSGPGDVYVSSGYGSVLRYDGKVWIEVKVPDGIQSIWGKGPGDVFFVGSQIVRYDGSSLHSSFHATEVGFTGITGVGPHDIFAVGNTPSYYPKMGYVYRYSSTTGWTKSTEVKWLKFNAVWAASPTSVFALGHSENGRVYHFDGSSWTSQSLPLDRKEKSFLSVIWGSSGQRVFAGGLYTLLSYNGRSWSMLAQPPGTYHHNIRGLWGTGATLFVAADEWNGASTLWRATCTP
jgi:hypothetical protein